MASIVIDLSTYKDRFGAYVTPGRYTVQVEDVEYGLSSQKKTPQIELWLRILNVVDGDEDAQGKTLTERLFITEKSMFRLVGFMDAVGLPTPRKKFSLDPQKFNGRILDVIVADDEPYNGNVRSRITGYEKARKKTAPAATADVASEEDEFEAEGIEEFSAGPHSELSSDVDDLPDDADADFSDGPEEPAEEPEPASAKPAAKQATPKAQPQPEPAAEPEPEDDEELSEIEKALAEGNDEDDAEGDDTYDLDSLDI